VEVSSGEDDVTKKSAGDYAGDGGASSAEPIPISSNVLEQADPSVTDWVASIEPPASRCRCKHPPACSQVETIIIFGRSGDDPTLSSLHTADLKVH
jgi:hypothetical protein